MNQVWQQSSSDIHLEDNEIFYKIDKQETDTNLYPGDVERPADYKAYRWPIDDREIIKSDRDYFSHFKTIKTSYLRLSEKVAMTKSVMEKSYNQARSMEALMRYAIMHYE